MSHIPPAPPAPPEGPKGRSQIQLRPLVKRGYAQLRPLRAPKSLPPEARLTLLTLLLPRLLEFWKGILEGARGREALKGFPTPLELLLILGTFLLTYLLLQGALG